MIKAIFACFVVSIISIVGTHGYLIHNYQVSSSQIKDCEEENRALSQFIEDQSLNKCTSIDLLRGCYERLDKFRFGDYE